ncbi:MAG: putative membrane protein YkoI [Pseudohongiellaceae bacterium]|jgi:uncharacterized membrane protein YkoI
MRKFKASFNVLVAAAIFFFGVSISAAQNLQSPQIEPNQLDRAQPANPSRDAQLANPKVSERQAVGLARDQFAGNVLRISLIGQGNGLRYQIRMENEGKVFTVFVSAINGRVTRSS